jgi:hypothetical protein
MSFRDRRQAGQELAAALAGYKKQRVVVLALPRGGGPVAAEIALTNPPRFDAVSGTFRSSCRPTSADLIEPSGAPI